MTYFMAIHPDVAGKLRAEVLQHYGPNGAPNHDNIRDLRYSKRRLFLDRSIDKIIV